MSDEGIVYDLGEVRSGAKKHAPNWREGSQWRELPDTGASETPTRDSSPSPSPAFPDTSEDTAPTAKVIPSSPASASPRSVLAVCLAMVLPGAGQVVQQRPVAGASWAAVFVGLLGALLGSWSILPRLWAAADALGLPAQASVWFLGLLFASLVSVHLGTLFAVQWTERRMLPGATQPVGAASASLVIPGWGQLLNGHSFRGSACVLLTWTVALAWLLSTGAVQEMLVAYQLHLPGPLAALAGPTLRWALPAALWPLAVYDAGLWAWILRGKN